MSHQAGVTQDDECNHVATGTAASCVQSHA